MPVGSGSHAGLGFGGSGVIYISGTYPGPGEGLLDGSPIRFIVGVQGSSIRLDTVVIKVDGVVTYDGASDTFSGLFSSNSSYEASVPDNGYIFNLVPDSSLQAGSITINIEAQTLASASTNQNYSVVALQPVVYPAHSPGLEIGRVSQSRFGGEVSSGLLSGAAGQVFVTPAFTERSGSSISLESIELEANSGDIYEYPDEDDGIRPWLWGPPDGVPREWPPTMSVSYEPQFNDSFGFLSSGDSSTKGTLIDTSIPETTIILI